MKKILLTLLLLGLYGTTMAQETPPPSPTAMVVPEVTKPSVDAFALTKFGDIPINEYTGMVNASIPLYTLQSGHLSLPITLNYNAAGVKVSQPATWTGINWTLSAGGVITRTVNDKPDEADYLEGRLTAEMIDPAGLYNGSSHAIWLNRIFAKLRRIWDVKPDQFYFNFPGYSGSFFFDVDFVPRLTKADSNLKIEIMGSDPDNKIRFRQSQEFRLITPEGIKYYFGGATATETTFVGTRMDNPYVPTAYYLTRIDHPESGTIMLEYDSDSVNKTIRMDQVESLTVKVYEFDTSTRDCVRPPTVEQDHTTTVNNTITANGKTLTKIKGAGSEITFNSTNGSSLHYRKVLNSIEIKQGATVVNTINLTYLFPGLPTFSERFFLTKVEFNKNNNYGHGRKYEQYTMEYDDPLALPTRTSSARDALGYYNGKTFNSTALPQNNDLYFHNYYPNLADRSSDFASAVKGALKKIIYPTGGYSEFEYEMEKSKDYVTDGLTMDIWRNNTARNPVNKTSVNGAITGDLYQNPDGTFGFTGAFENQTIKGIINVLSTSQMGHTDVIVLKISDLSANTIQEITFRMPDGNQEIGTGRYDFSKEFTFDIVKDHQYAFQLYNNYQLSTTQFDAQLYFTYRKGTKLIDDGKLRVKRTTDYTAASEQAFVKRYYYTSMEDYFKNPLDLVTFKKNHEYITDWQLTKCCNGGGEAPLEQKQQFEINFRTFSSNPLTPISELERNYEHVLISYGGDNFELGGKYKRFNNSVLGINQDIWPIHQSVFQQERASYKGNAGDIYQGTLLEEIDLTKRGSILYKVRQKNWQYRYEDQANITGVIGGYAYFNCLFKQSGITNFDLRKYQLLSRKVQLVKEKAYDFTTPVLYTVNPDNTQDAYLSTTTDYWYDGLIGLPTMIVTTTSEDGMVSRVHYTYADQTNLVPDATPAQIAALNKLVELNKVSEPITVRTFYGLANGIPPLTGTKITYYKSWNNNPNRILPELVRFSKGSGALEDRILIEKYDAYGNMVQVRLKDGAPTYYQYNSRNQVTLTIENYAPADPVDGNEEVTLPEPIPGGPCTISQTFPGSIVTYYYYDATTFLLTRTLDTNCRNTYYEYDSLMRLKRIKDHDGNTIEEYDNNYRTN